MLLPSSLLLFYLHQTPAVWSPRIPFAVIWSVIPPTEICRTLPPSRAFTFSRPVTDISLHPAALRLHYSADGKRTPSCNCNLACRLLSRRPRTTTPSLALRFSAPTWRTNLPSCLEGELRSVTSTLLLSQPHLNLPLGMPRAIRYAGLHI